MAGEMQMALQLCICMAFYDVSGAFARPASGSAGSKLAFTLGPAVCAFPFLPIFLDLAH